MQTARANGLRFDFIAAIILFAVVIADQIVKTAVAANATDVVLIKGLLSITYTKNTGAAFSFLNDKDWAQTFFTIATVLALGAFAFFYYRTDNNNRLLKYSLVLIVGGALGNFIDRLAFGYVVDMISIHFFPAVFNVADAALTVGAVMFVVHFCFFDRDALFRRRTAK